MTKQVIKLTVSLLFVLVCILSLSQWRLCSVTMSAIDGLSQQDLELMREQEEVNARTIFQSMERGVAESLERGEMEKFSRMLAEQKSVKDLLEFSLIDRNGVVTHSSHQEAIGRTVDEETRKRVESTWDVTIEKQPGFLEIYQTHRVVNDCIRCHKDWKLDSSGGIAYIKYSTASADAAQHQSEEMTAATWNKVFDSSIWSLAVSLVVATVLFVLLIVLLIYLPVVRPMTRVLKEVELIAEEVSGRSQDLATATTQLSSGAQEQASSLEETAASLEEITSTVQQNAGNAKQANQLSAESKEAAENGGNVTTRAIQGMEEITEASEKISSIITTINEIAFQTNLLALNAAVEAARAGDQGRGFAVVAGEVRNLAQRSADAAKEIENLIRDSLEKVNSGSELVGQSGQTLQDIVTSVKRVSDIVGEITVASSEQATGIDQVNKAVSQMDQVVQSNAAQTERLSGMSDVLATQANRLQQVVQEFHSGGKKRKPRSKPTQPVQTASPSRTANRPTASSNARSPRQDYVQNHPIENEFLVGVGADDNHDNFFEEF